MTKNDHFETQKCHFWAFLAFFKISLSSLQHPTHKLQNLKEKYNSFVSEKPSNETKPDPALPAWRYACSLKYVIIIIFYTTLQVRVSSFQSWLYPWLKWTFSTQDAAQAEYNVSLMMDVYGYSYFLSIFIAPLPGLFIKWMQRVFKSKLIGEQRAVTIIMLLAGPLNT